MALERRKHQHTSASAPPAPPRTLDVRKFAESRAPELQSISNRLNNNFKSQQNKRRRTTGFDNRSNRKKNYSRKRLKLLDKKEDENLRVRLPRRVRRRIDLRKNPESGFCTSGDGTKRLRTHLWHSKRFTMAKKWGFFLPFGLPGRGKGSRALLKWFKHGALLHDASYNIAVQLEGPEDSLLSIFRMVLVPTPSLHLDQLSTSIRSGITYGSAMLHHVGAPFSPLISPVTYLWRPFVRRNFDTDSEINHTSGDISTSSSLRSSFRQLCVWIHAGAMKEGLGALRLACQKQMEENGISVNCLSLEGQLAKLEVMGSKAIEILQKILHPVSGTSGSSLDTMKSPVQRSFILEHAVHLPDHAIISLHVKDPRKLPKKGPKSVSEVASNSLGGDVIKHDSSDHSSLTVCTDQNRNIISSLWLNSEANSVLYSDNKDLWEYHNVVNHPVEENLLCLEKHQKRMSFFHLDKNPGTSTTDTKEQSCPVLLLKKNNLGGSSVRWDIILPLSWVKAFWLPLINHGAHVVGVRERRWIACDVGLPSFPFDFPDCKTYSCFMAAEAIASDEKMELRPLAMRPSKVPIEPPWESVRLAFKIKPPAEGNIQDFREEKLDREGNGCYSWGNIEGAQCESETLEQDGSPFIGIIARTSSILIGHLNEIHGDHLQLFPFEQMGKKQKNTKLGEIRDKVVIGSERDSYLSVDRKLCFLRVLLRAYKEGFFEEGSVVCAPLLTDILLWTSRSDVQEGRLQIPQSLIGSYFTQQAGGKWEIQKPEDPETREFHRWPIGFVTTGFVRGSTKPTAEAFCEATLLAQLRNEQWEGKRGKSEIFVLVRNVRSAAYRLALATIVLEKQTEDVEFM